MKEKIKIYEEKEIDVEFPLFLKDYKNNINIFISKNYSIILQDNGYFIE